MTKPSFTATNLSSVFPQQPFDFSSSATITTWTNKDSVGTFQILDVHDSAFSTPLTFGTFSTSMEKILPDLLTEAATADSITVDYKLWISTND
ncbi:MAG: hypothetical protein WDO15_20750 [Bacteroidota bacterium]